MKKLLFLLLAFAAPVFAQNPTIVSGTITDPNGVAWYPGTVTASLTPVTTNPTANGQPINPNPGTNMTVKAQTNPNGSFTMSLFPNSAITPASTQWVFYVSTIGAAQPGGVGPKNFTVTITISGSTQDVGATLTAAAPALLSSGGGGGTNSGVPPNTYSLQTTSCGTATNCTQIKGDGRYVVDATSTSTTTVTAPDGNFTSADVGKTVWATTPGSGIGIGLLIYTTVVCPVTTIATVNSATSITLNATCTASAAGNAVLILGTKDGTALHALDAKIGCSTVTPPTNSFILVDQSFLITPNSCSSTAGNLTHTIGTPQAGLIGQGSSTIFIITPDFNWASCTGAGAVSGGVCIGSALSQMAGFAIWGTGLTSAANANCANGANKVILAGGPIGGAIYAVDVAGVCPGTSGMVGVEMNTLDEQFSEGGVQEVGTTACVTSSIGVETFSLDCHNFNVAGGIGMSVLANSSQNDYGTYPYGVTSVSGSLNSHGSHFQGIGATAAMTINSGGKHYSEGDYWCDNGTSTGSFIAAGGYETIRNAKFSCSGVGVNNNSTANQFFDGGGNTLSGGAVGTFSGLYNGKNSLIGAQTNTTVANRNSSLSSTILLPTTATFAGASVPIITVTLYAMDATPLGASCAGNTTVVWTFSYFDAGGAAQTQTATETITGNGVAGGDKLATSFQIYLANANTITYSTVVTPGGSCSPVPSYTAIVGVQ